MLEEPPLQLVVLLPFLSITPGATRDLVYVSNRPSLIGRRFGHVPPRPFVLCFPLADHVFRREISWGEWARFGAARRCAGR